MAGFLPRPWSTRGDRNRSVASNVKGRGLTGAGGRWTNRQECGPFCADRSWLVQFGYSLRKLLHPAGRSIRRRSRRTNCRFALRTSLGQAGKAEAVPAARRCRSRRCPGCRTGPPARSSLFSRPNSRVKGNDRLHRCLSLALSERTSHESKDVRYCRGIGSSILVRARPRRRWRRRRLWRRRCCRKHWVGWRDGRQRWHREHFDRDRCLSRSFFDEHRGSGQQDDQPIEPGDDATRWTKFTSGAERHGHQSERATIRPAADAGLSKIADRYGDGYLGDRLDSAMMAAWFVVIE